MSRIENLPGSCQFDPDRGDHSRQADRFGASGLTRTALHAKVGALLAELLIGGAGHVPLAVVVHVGMIPEHVGDVDALRTDPGAGTAVTARTARLGKDFLFDAVQFRTRESERGQRLRAGLTEPGAPSQREVLTSEETPASQRPALIAPD